MIFSIIFFLEAAIKILAKGKFYFKDGWNLVDFSIVLVTIFSMLISIFTIYEIGETITILRSLRVFRLIKLVKMAKPLKLIFSTMVKALPNLFNVAFLLVLFLYIYSILAINLFADVKFSG